MNFTIRGKGSFINAYEKEGNYYVELRLEFESRGYYEEHVRAKIPTIKTITIEQPINKYFYDCIKNVIDVDKIKNLEFELNMEDLDLIC